MYYKYLVKYCPNDTEKDRHVGEYYVSLIYISNRNSWLLTQAKIQWAILIDEYESNTTENIHEENLYYKNDRGCYVYEKDTIKYFKFEFDEIVQSMDTMISLK